jgi:hypothetical protein
MHEDHSQQPTLLQDSSNRTPQEDLSESVRAFLTTWYIDKDLRRLDEFVASDNFMSFAKETGPSAQPTWADIFRTAFSSKASELRGQMLTDVITYYEPSRPPEARPFEYLNAGINGLPRDPFAIVSPKSVPNQVFFASGFLKHLQQRYDSKNELRLVIYVTKEGKGLVREAAVTYWIKDRGKWKIAAYRGWD